MKNFILRLLVVCTLASLSLSAFEMGYAFHYENRDKLVIDKTTLDEVYKYFGKPEKTIVSENVNGKFHILEYYFVHSGFTGGDMKVLLIELKDEVLIGYVYDSSQGDDSTLFNYEEAMNVRIGHKFEHVKRNVGDPSGEALCPVNIHKYKENCSKSKNMKVWIYTPGTSVFGASSVETHMMFVGVTDEGIVLEVSHKILIGGEE